MPRIVAGSRLELRYLSPNEMVAHLGALAEGKPVLVETSAGLPPGVVRDLVITVPWLGRVLNLKATVMPAADGGTPEPGGIRLHVDDGPRDTVDQLLGIIGRFRSGASIADQDPDIPTERRIRTMSPDLRAVLALRGAAEERQVLARDVDPRVIEFLLRNPGITLEEVRRLAGRLNLNHGHFSRIMRNPAWMSDDMLRAALARNPRLPEILADTVLAVMSTPMLKGLAEAANTTASTRRVAKRILQGRGVLVSARRGMV